jgi:hypothetical protein
MPVVEDYIPFVGGLDTVTPPMTVNPGTARDSQNAYQDINSGYSTGFGYERFDGQPSPSSAVYSMLSVNITGSVSVGDTLLDSGTATGVVIAIESNAVALTKVTGTFVTGNILVGVTVVGTCTGPQIDNAATSIELNSMYKNLAADQYRADILAVPGSGIIRGVVQHKDVVYAVRDNVGATAAEFYKSTSSGWSKITLGYSIAFTSGGTYVVSAGDTTTGATSGATATVTRIDLTSGTWAGGDAAGTLYLKTQTGTFQAENLDVGANLNVATIAGDSTETTLSAGGTYEFIIANFGAESNTEYIYGCDGVNEAFEFRGDTLLPISTGLTSDAPTHIAEFKYRLVLSFGPAVQISALGDPFTWSLLLGSAAISVQEDITSLQVQSGQQDTGTLAIFSRNSIHMLYDKGSGTVSDWQNVSYKRGTGSIEWSPQILGNQFFFDDRGIINLSTAQSYGNFYDSAESNQILNWLTSRKNIVTHSCLIREKNIYCIFFSDKSALYMTVSKGNIVSLMPQMYDHIAHRVWSSENSNGDEEVYFGDANGFIHQLGVGTSFDGGEIEWWIDMAYSHFGSPYRMKRYRRGILEIQGDGFAKFYFTYSLGYASVDIAQPDDVLSDTNLSRSQWDVFTWDAFFWDGVNLAPTDIRMAGTGENISIKLRGSSDYYDQIRFSGIQLQYSPVRRKR